MKKTHIYVLFTILLVVSIGILIVDICKEAEERTKPDYELLALDNKISANELVDMGYLNVSDIFDKESQVINEFIDDAARGAKKELKLFQIDEYNTVRVKKLVSDSANNYITMYDVILGENEEKIIYLDTIRVNIINFDVTEVYLYELKIPNSGIKRYLGNVKIYSFYNR